jgi:hypothetical protein
MGIEDRDYMRRRPERDDDGSGEAAFEGGAGRFLRRFPRIGLWLALALGALILVALLLARSSLP